MSETNGANETPETEGPKGTATENDLTRIVTHPEDFGFEWDSSWSAASETDNSGKRFGSKVILRANVPAIPKVTDVEKFGKAFGWVILAKAWNGTSGRVDGQQIVRSMLLAEWAKDRAKSVTNDTLRREVAKRILLGIRAKGGGGFGTRYVALDGTAFKTAEEATAHNAKNAPKVTYKGLDGQEYGTALEAKQASVAFYVTEHGMPHEVAVKLVANMPE